VPNEDASSSSRHPPPTQSPTSPHNGSPALHPSYSLTCTETDPFCFHHPHVTPLEPQTRPFSGFLVILSSPLPCGLSRPLSSLVRLSRHFRVLKVPRVLPSCATPLLPCSVGIKTSVLLSLAHFCIGERQGRPPPPPPTLAPVRPQAASPAPSPSAGDGVSGGAAPPAGDDKDGDQPPPAGAAAAAAADDAPSHKDGCLDHNKSPPPAGSAATPAYSPPPARRGRRFAAARGPPRAPSRSSEPLLTE